MQNTTEKNRHPLAQSDPEGDDMKRNQYLDTLEQLICCNYFYGPSPRPITKHGRRNVWYGKPLHLLAKSIEVFGVQLCAKATDTDWPELSDSMLPIKDLRQIREALETVEDNAVLGSFVECGVWRGGACVYAKAVINELESNRAVFGCDSFDGLPKPTLEQDKGDKHHTFSTLAVPLEEVERRAAKYNVGEIFWIPGWFKDTLPKLYTLIAVLRIDGDMYESTMDILMNLYPRVEHGGIVIIDDYQYLHGCREAVHDYFKGPPPRMLMRDKHSPIEFVKP